MDPQRPRVMYGRYYYGQEAIIRNDDANIQLHRTETSGHIRNAQPIDSYGSRRMQAIRIGNVGANHENGVGPRIGNFEGYGVGPSIGNFEGYGVGPSIENFEGYGVGPIIGNFEGYGSVNNPSSLSGRYEQTGTRHNNCLSNDRDGSFERNRQNHHVNGRQQHNLFGSERQRPGSFAGDFDSHLPTNSFEYGRQPPDSFEVRSQKGVFGSNNIADFDDARRSSSSWDRRNYNSYDRQPTTSYDFGRRQQDSFEGGEKPPTLSFEDRSQGESHNFFVNDVNSDNERSKLIMRIRKLYDEETIQKNLERFDEQSWVKVSYLLSGGLKTYIAQMTCPVCFGSASPYNRETEPGRIPKWDLFSVKRHVALFHPKKGVATETVNEEKKEGPSEQKRDDPAKTKPIEPIAKEVESSEEEARVPEEKKKLSLAKTVRRVPLKKTKSKGISSSQPIDKEVESSEVEETVPKMKQKTSSAKTRASLKKAKSKGKSSSEPVDKEVESSEVEEAAPKKKQKTSSAKTRASLKKAKSKGKSSVDKEVESSEVEEIVPKEKQKTSSAKTRASLKKAKSKDMSSNSTDSSELSDDSTIYSTSESDLETKSTGNLSMIKRN